MSARGPPSEPSDKDHSPVIRLTQASIGTDSSACRELNENQKHKDIAPSQLALVPFASKTTGLQGAWHYCRDGWVRHGRSCAPGGGPLTAMRQPMNLRSDATAVRVPKVSLDDGLLTAGGSCVWHDERPVSEWASGSGVPQSQDPPMSEWMIRTNGWVSGAVLRHGGVWCLWHDDRTKWVSPAPPAWATRQRLNECCLWGSFIGGLVAQPLVHSCSLWGPYTPGNFLSSCELRSIAIIGKRDLGVCGTPDAPHPALLKIFLKSYAKVRVIWGLISCDKSHREETVTGRY